MIEYLFHNTINETILMHTVYDQSRTAPSFNSWRDILAIFFLILLIRILIYLFVCLNGFSISDRFIRCLFNRFSIDFDKNNITLYGSIVDNSFETLTSTFGDRRSNAIVKASIHPFRRPPVRTLFSFGLISFHSKHCHMYESFSSFSRIQPQPYSKASMNDMTVNALLKCHQT